MVWGTRVILGVDTTVITVVGTMVGSGVAISVGGAVGTVVGTGVATAAGWAGWVHPQNIAKIITRMNNPMNLFIEITL